MTDATTTLVAGLGRCGTTMLMQMLAAADVRTVGSAPDWECVTTNRLLENDPAGWAVAVQGKAVKVLDAHRYQIPRLGGAVRMIWLHRDERQQARSMIRFLNLAFAGVTENRNSVRQMEKGIVNDTPTALRRLDQANPTMRGIALQFERILSEPVRMSRVICEHLGIPQDRAMLMAAQVRHRGPKCLSQPRETLHA